jgi:hypothetical protein
MHGKDRPLSPAGHFAMTEKYALMYYDDDQTKKNGTGKLECFCENECGLSRTEHFNKSLTKSESNK